MSQNADLVVTMTLDGDKAIKQQEQLQKRMLREAKQMEDRWERIQNDALRRREARFEQYERTVARAIKASTVGTIAAFRMAGSALDAYAQKYPESAQGARELKSAVEDLWVSIGRDLDPGASVLAKWIAKLDEFRQKLTDSVRDADVAVSSGIVGLGLDAVGIKIADAFGVDTSAAKAEFAANMVGAVGEFNQESSAALQSAQTKQEASERFAAQSRLLETKQAELDARMLEATGQAGAAERARDMLAHRRFAEETTAWGRENGIGNNIVEAMIAKDLAIMDRREFSRQDANSDFARKMRDQDAAAEAGVSRRVEDISAEQAISALRLRGKEDEAQAMERQLRLEQQIHEVTHDTTLEWEQRERIINSLNDAHEATESIIRGMSRKDRQRMLSPQVLSDGLSGISSVRSVVFGGASPLESLGRQQVTRLTEIKDVLQRIQQSPGRGGAFYS